MSRLLLNLRNVDDDEIEAVRALLDARHIAFHETPPGPWGISGGAIWVTNDEQFIVAKQAFDAYQHHRAARARQELEAARRAGTAPGFIDLLREEPLRVLVGVVGVLVALCLIVLPILLLRG